MNRPLAIIIGGIIVVLFIGAIGVVLTSSRNQVPQTAQGPTPTSQLPDNLDATVCPMDAKQCPDGSTVGREGPDCEFAPCPVEPTAPSGRGPQNMPDQVTDIDSGSGAAISMELNQQTQVLFSQDELNQLWTQMYASQPEPPQPPSVEFSQNAAIAAFAGQQPTGGTSIEVSSVEETEDQVLVTFTITQPGAGCITTQALTNPYTIIALPNTGKQFVTSFQTQTSECQ